MSARLDWTALPIADGVLAAAEDAGVDVVSLVCGGGEDFALLAAVPPAGAAELAEAAGRAEDVPAAVVGEVLAVGGEPPHRPSVTLRLPDGGVRDLTALGYDHFRKPPGPTTAGPSTGRPAI